MNLDKFPEFLKPVFEKNFFEREFEYGFKSNLGYHLVADKLDCAAELGKPILLKREGLKPFTQEEFVMCMDHYSPDFDLHVSTQRHVITSQLLQNTATHAEHAGRSFNKLAKNVLFNSCFSGNTRITHSSLKDRTELHVDDIRGFRSVSLEEYPSSFSESYPMMVLVGSNVYELIGSEIDSNNTSKTISGKSGKLFFSEPIFPEDMTKGHAVKASTASTIIRPRHRHVVDEFTSSDLLTVQQLLDAVSILEDNSVPFIHDQNNLNENYLNYYHCYLDPISARQLLADDEFNILFKETQKEPTGNIIRQGTIIPKLKLKFIITTESHVDCHPKIDSLNIRRVIIAGQGALIQGNFTDMLNYHNFNDDIFYKSVNEVVMVMRPPINDNQTISQSWYWIGGFSAPADLSADPHKLPTYTNSRYKRAVMIEHVS